MGVSVAHGADHSEAIAGQRHVQIGEQDVKVLTGNVAERIAYVCYRNHFEAITFQRCLQHIADSVIVLGQQNSRHPTLLFCRTYSSDHIESSPALSVQNCTKVATGAETIHAIDSSARLHSSKDFPLITGGSV